MICSSLNRLLFIFCSFLSRTSVMSRPTFGVQARPIDCLMALEIAEQVACALIAAEKHHLVHRDMKPSNLMLVRESDGALLVKVIDFGLAKFTASQDEDDSLDGMTVGGFAGTPCF